MKTRMALLGFAAVLGFLFTGGAVHENFKARTAEDALTTTLRQRDALQRELRRAKAAANAGEQAAEKAEMQRDAFQKRIDELLAAQKTVPLPGGGAVPAAAKPIPNDFNRLIATNPEYQKTYLQYNRLRDGVMYARFYRQLAMSPQQIEAFENARMVRQQVEDDITAVAYEKGVSPTDAAFRPIRKQGNDECETRLREILGPVGYAAYKAYPKEMMTESRREVSTLADALFGTKLPFTVDQADALAHVIEANSVRPKNANQKTNWEAVYVQAQGILSPLQLAELKRGNEVHRLSMMMYEITKRPAP